MPLVTVRHWAKGLMEINEILTVLPEVLPEVVAEALHVESNEKAHLTKDDIEVIFDKGNRSDIHGNFDFSVRVEAMFFPERAERAEMAAKLIRDKVAEALVGLKGYVWLVLPVAAFVET